MSKSSGVIHSTSVSRPHLKRYQVKEKVVPNISQVKFTKKEVEDHHRISSISKKTKSVTACNDSSNSRTSNANAVCAECGKCVFNSNHDACVSRYLKDVNARTKKPCIVPISARMEWRIAKRCPSGYTWTQNPLRTKKIWMPKVRKDDESTSVSPTIDIVSRITNILKISNSRIQFVPSHPSSSNSHVQIVLVRLKLSVCSNSCYGRSDQGNVTIKNGFITSKASNHKIFSRLVHFCDADLEVAFQKITCFFVRDLQGNNLLTGSRGSDLYTISLQETTSSTPICFMAKASPTQAWLWHRRLSHLNFDYITLLSKKILWNAYLKYYNPTHDQAEENKNDQARNASFQEAEFINPFCIRVQEIGESSSRTIDNTDVHSFQPQSYDFRWTRDHPLEQVHGNPSMPVQTRRQLATDPGMCMFALTVSIVEPRNIKEAMADSAGSNNQMNFMQKALYGLKQAPRAWYDELSNFLMSKGFSKGTIDPTLFKIKYGEDILLVQIYVDDIIFGSTNPKYSKTICEKLMHNRIENVLNGEMKFFLGLQIHQSPKGIFINQAKYALEILKKHNMDNCHSIGTPLATKPKLDVDLSGEPVDQSDYRSKIGSLMYLTSSRPDLVQAVCYCARYQARPTQKHLKEMSKKQNCTAMSSAEAEYVALSASCAQVMWMRTQLQDYGFNYNKIPLTEYQLADMFTKAFLGYGLSILVRRIGKRCLTPAELEVLTNETLD
ncbi:retrovirus-related pol polyprotein from transposon TNT 1-94 [Tanacetum coccineum]